MRRSPWTHAIAALTAILLSGAPLRGQAADTAAAAAALAELETACDRAEALWPVPLCGPLVLVHPATRTAVANERDPAGAFTPLEGAWVGRWPDDMPVANTAVEWQGRPWAMVMLPLPTDRFDRLRLLAHESFHRIQGALGHEVADPMAAHLDEADGRLWLRMELRALARAVAATGQESREAATHALVFRATRHGLYPEAAAVESRLESHEGLAEYTGVRFALDATAAGPARAAELVERFEDRPTYVRSLGYGTGPALGLLLDRFAPGWRGTEPGPAPDLAGALAAALAEDVGAADYGYADVAAREAERAVRTAAIRDRYRRELIDGPALVLELPERRLMFNPNTVVAMGDAGNVYPGAILFGPWGQLTLHDGAALASSERDIARVRAPERLPPIGDRTVEGPGWTLELEPGWRLAPGEREGDIRPVPSDDV